MKKVVVTGVTGMDGSHMVDYILGLNDEFKQTGLALGNAFKVYGCVRRSSSPNLKKVEKNLDNPNFELVNFDLSDSASIDSVISKIKPDYFINFAAQSFVGSSWDIPEQTFDINATAVLRILNSIKNHCPECRFYSAGSSEEFGDVLYSPQDEEHPLRPRSPYGAAKAAARHIVKVYRESFGIFAVQGYLFNHESPRRGEEFVTQKIIQSVKKIRANINYNEPFESLKLGNIYAQRDWSHSKDFVRGIFLMLCQSEPIEYVLSSGETNTVKYFVEKTLDLANLLQGGKWVGEGVDEKFIHSKHGVIVEIDEAYYRPCEVDLLLGDSSKIKRKLDWEPEFNIDKLIEDMYYGE